ncbi:TPA: hypothetical protein VBX77_001492 [Yersinia enterocolitica]|nr:hypothetical protein [Yersinia enterocolitica]
MTSFSSAYWEIKEGYFKFLDLNEMGHTKKINGFLISGNGSSFWNEYYSYLFSNNPQYK